MTPLDKTHLSGPRATGASGGIMGNQYVVVRFKNKKEFKIYEATNAEEVTIGGAKVWQPRNPDPPFRKIKALKIQNEEKTIKVLPLDGIESWALMESEIYKQE